jgi:hypothetical protein
VGYLDLVSSLVNLDLEAKGDEVRSLWPVGQPEINDGWALSFASLVDLVYSDY